MAKVSTIRQPQKPPTRPTTQTIVKSNKRPILFPILPLFFVCVWAWGTFYYHDIFRIAREQSFWVASASQMKFVLDQSFGGLWYMGRMLLQLFRYPALGSLILAFLLSQSSWCLGYCMRVNTKWRWVQYIPALIYIAFLSHEGLDLFYEAETGRIMGIPLLAAFILFIWAFIISRFSKKDLPAMVRYPKDETRKQNYVQLMVCVVGIMASVLFTQWKRPYVPVITRMMVGQINQDWEDIKKTAQKHANLSYRPIAAYYAMALVQTDKVGVESFDLRMDYDSLYLHGWGKELNGGNSLYLAEGDYYAGLVQTCYHHAFERMVMDGPSVHGMELMVKCALLRGEWELAEKYLRILQDVPFEKGFCKKYKAMVRQPKRVNDDAEMAVIRKLEPLHDSFENLYQQPTFLGYNLYLYEGRSIEAVKNSLAVCIYTKLMPNFIQRLEPFVNQYPPENFSDAILLMSGKYPELPKQFKDIDWRRAKLQKFMQETSPYMHDRAKYAKELFQKYKGYYPYYYYFGNLKATKKKDTQKQTSNSGVN